MTDGTAPAVKVSITRRPHARRRRFELVTRLRLRNLSAPLEIPGVELAEVPIVGVVILAAMAVLALFVVGVLLGGFLVALIELIIIALLALVGSSWAWFRGHPKVAVANIGEQTWLRDQGPSVSPTEDARMISEGADPTMLGYRQAD